MQTHTLNIYVRELHEPGLQAERSASLGNRVGFSGFPGYRAKSWQGSRRWERHDNAVYKTYETKYVQPRARGKMRHVGKRTLKAAFLKL